MAEDAAAEAVYHKALEAFSQKRYAFWIHVSGQRVALKLASIAHEFCGVQLPLCAPGLDRNGPRKLHIAILFGLAEATSALQKLEVAAQYYSRVVDAVPDHSKAVAALAQLEFKLNLRARATSSNTNGAAANTSTSIESKEMVHVNSTGKLEIHRRRPTLSLSAVEQLFLRALECNPNDTQNLINFAQFMRTARNNHDGAKNLLYKVFCFLNSSMHKMRKCQVHACLLTFCGLWCPSCLAAVCTLNLLSFAYFRQHFSNHATVVFLATMLPFYPSAGKCLGRRFV